MSISSIYDKDIKYCSNRKEVKDHGDTGILLGSPICDGDKVVIIEDVTTARNVHSGNAADHQGSGRCECPRTGGIRRPYGTGTG